MESTTLSGVVLLLVLHSSRTLEGPAGVSITPTFW